EPAQLPVEDREFRAEEFHAASQVDDRSICALTPARVDPAVSEIHRAGEVLLARRHWCRRLLLRQHTPRHRDPDRQQFHRSRFLSTWLPWIFWWQTVQLRKRGEDRSWKAGGTTPVVPVFVGTLRLAWHSRHTNRTSCLVSIFAFCEPC